MNLDSLGNFNLKNYIPDFSGMAVAAFEFLLIIAIMGVIGFFIWWYLDKRKYKYKIEIFENLGGVQYQRAGTDVAKLIRVGNTGEEALYLKKRKKILPASGRKMGFNTFWFAIGQDGIWHNIALGDLDAAKGLLDIEVVDKDMRAWLEATKRNAEARFKKEKWMEKYGILLFQGIFLIIIVMAIGYLVSKVADASSGFIEASKAMAEVAKTNQQVLASLDKVCSGSGLIRP